MDPIVELPDAEIVLVHALDAATSGMLVTWDLPLGNRFDEIIASQPIVLVTRIGGRTKYRKAWDEVVFDIDVYAKSKTLASSTVKTVRAQVEALRNTVVTGYGTVAGTYEESGTTSRPENNPKVTRLGFTTRILIRPN